jgi:hypothetical protein
MPIVKAVQELNDKNILLEKTIDILQAENEKMKKAFVKLGVTIE